MISPDYECHDDNRRPRPELPPRRETNSVTLNWTAPTGAVTYNIYRGTTPAEKQPAPLATGVGCCFLHRCYRDQWNTYYYKVTGRQREHEHNTPTIPSESGVIRRGISHAPGGQFACPGNFSGRTRGPARSWRTRISTVALFREAPPPSSIPAV